MGWSFLMPEFERGWFMLSALASNVEWLNMIPYAFVPDYQSGCKIRCIIVILLRACIQSKLIQFDWSKVNWLSILFSKVSSGCVLFLICFLLQTILLSIGPKIGFRIEWMIFLKNRTACLFLLSCITHAYARMWKRSRSSPLQFNEPPKAADLSPWKEEDETLTKGQPKETTAVTN